MFKRDARAFFKGFKGLEVKRKVLDRNMACMFWHITLANPSVNQDNLHIYLQLTVHTSFFSYFPLLEE